MDDQTLAIEISKAVLSQGGHAYAVGGWVRDRILGLIPKDLDLEVHGLSEEALLKVLRPLGTPLAMGKSFGIWSLAGTHLDISLPKRPDGTPAPDLGIRDSARRRDFTCNAMLEDLLTGEILDPFGGKQDLQAGILRPVTENCFQEDPLRVFRMARLSARFGFLPAPGTEELCKGLSLDALFRERVFAELQKALMESPRPSVFFEVLRNLKALDPWFTQVRALIGVPQPPRYHGEGDVWNHTMLVLDAAVPLKSHVRDPFGFLLAALVHDFGKVITTTETPTGIHAYGHETAGLPLVRAFLRALTNQKDRIAYVENLTALHMQPNALAGQNSSPKAYYKLLDKALDPKALLALAAADDLGRITQAPHISRQDLFSQRLSEYEALCARPQVTGSDLIQAGIQPSPAFSAYLSYARKLHLSGVPKESALKQTLSYVKSRT